MRALGCLLSVTLLLSASASGQEAPGRRRLFAPGTGTSCTSFCSQRWYGDAPSVRACFRECHARTLTGTVYFRGGMRGDRLDCNELLVRPAGGTCASQNGRLASDGLDFPGP